MLAVLLLLLLLLGQRQVWELELAAAALVGLQASALNRWQVPWWCNMALTLHHSSSSRRQGVRLPGWK
jgi:hypothetical protein